jgi:hypothetical protein
MKRDPAIEAVRAVRHMISARCGHDPKRLLQYYLQRQEKARDRLVPSPGRAGVYMKA